MKENVDQPSQSIVRYAQWYASEKNWSVFPVNLEKAPIVKGGFKSATVTKSDISRLFNNSKAVGIGVPTGSKTGFFVLDIDGPRGELQFAQLECMNGFLPKTVEVITGRETGGRHLYFKIPDGKDIRNSAGKIGEEIDIRGEGGYVVVPPSHHSSGSEYRFKEDCHVRDIEIADPPEWLIELIIDSKSDAPTGHNPCTTLVSDNTEYGSAALKSETECISNSSEGTRNDTLNRSAFAIGQLIAGGEVSEASARAELLKAALATGLPEQEATRTLNNSLSAGMQVPRKPKVNRNNQSKPIVQATSDEDPLPLYRPLTESEEFPVNAMGNIMGPATIALAKIVQVPTALAANSILAAASLATQAHCNVVLPIGHGEPHPVSLFLVTIASSSDRKSTTDRLACSSINEYEAEQELLYQESQKVYKQELAFYKKLHDTALRDLNFSDSLANPSLARASYLDNTRNIGDEPLSPLQPAILVSDPTYEGLVKQLINGQPSLGLFSSEGALMVGGHALNEDNKRKTVGGLCKLWDGDTLNRVRASETTSRIAGRRLSFHLMLQPGVASEFLSDPVLLDQGFLSRILTCAPESLAGKRIFRESQQVDLMALDLFEDRILELLQQPRCYVEDSRQELLPRSISMDEDALEVWKDYYNTTERQQLAGKSFEHIRFFAGKLPEHAARLASVIALIENPNIERVDGVAMSNGVKLAKYYSSEALRLIEAKMCDPEILKAQKLLDWIQKTWKDDFISIPDMYTYGPSPLRQKKTADLLAKILTEHGWLRSTKKSKEIKGKVRREVFFIVRPDQSA